MTVKVALGIETSHVSTDEGLVVRKATGTVQHVTDPQKITVRPWRSSGGINLVETVEPVTLPDLAPRVIMAGPPGKDGLPGQGVPIGGLTGQALTKKSNDNYDTQWTTPVLDHGALTGLADDDHSQYWNDTRGNAKIAAHEAAANPHPTYATDADLTAHVAAADPHTGYQKESEKGVANGYPSLDATGKIPSGQLPPAGVSDHGALTGLSDDDHPQYWNDARGGAKIAAHEAAADPHPVYLTSAEGDAKITAHEAKADPHPTYLTAAEGNAAYEAAGAVATHAAAADPHTGYQKESEKAAASGYASLDGSIKVPIAQVPTGTSGTTVALGNHTHSGDVPTTRQVISGGGLTGGGDLSADRTLAVGSGTGITVNADDVAVNRTTVDTWYTAAPYAVAFGDATNLTYVITHNKGRRNVHVEVFQTASPYEKVDCVIRFTSTTTLTVVLLTAPGVNGYTISVM